MLVFTLGHPVGDLRVIGGCDLVEHSLAYLLELQSVLELFDGCWVALFDFEVQSFAKGLLNEIDHIVICLIEWSIHQVCCHVHGQTKHKSVVRFTVLRHLFLDQAGYICHSLALVNRVGFL